MEVVATHAREPATSSSRRLRSAFRTGLRVTVPAIAIAVVAVEAPTHVRGVGFFLGLRYLVVAPACLVASLCASLLYARLRERVPHPGRTLAAVVLGIAAVLLVGLGSLVGARVLPAAAPVVVGVAGVLAVLIPRSFETTRRRRVRTALLGVSGAAFALLLLPAIASERAVPSGRDGLPFDVPRTLFDVEHRFIDLPGGARVHYVDEGSGATLLFLHGNPAWSFQWRDLIRGLRGSYRCVALDYPGFGMSTAQPGFEFTPREESEVVEQFVTALHLQDVTLVMQDWGGPIGIGLAGRRPELVRRVVLGNTWAWPTDASEPRGLFSKIAGGAIGEFVQINFNGFAKTAVKNGVIHALPEDVLGLYIRPFQPIERRGVAAFYPGQITDASDYFAETEAGLPKIGGCPALIFWGLRDVGFPRKDLERFERAFPNHKTVEFADADHFFFEDTSEPTIAEIRAFLATSSPPPHTATTSPSAK